MVSVKINFYTSDKVHVTLDESVPEKDLEGKTFDEVHRMTLRTALFSGKYDEAKLLLIQQHSIEYRDSLYSLQTSSGYLTFDKSVKKYIQACECIGNCDEGKELRYTLNGPLH